MAADYVIRCTPDNREVDSYRVRDGSGEIMYFQQQETAIGFAMDMQDSSRHASYTVEPANA